jgi:hypothetical protein
MKQERIRSLADLLTAAALISASAVLIWVSLSGAQAPTSRRPAPPIYKIGEILEVVDPQDVTAPLTLVMFFRDGCRYCSESMEFYRRLGAEPNRARLLVVGRKR